MCCCCWPSFSVPRPKRSTSALHQLSTRFLVTTLTFKLRLATTNRFLASQALSVPNLSAIFTAHSVKLMLKLAPTTARISSLFDASELTQVDALRNAKRILFLPSSLKVNTLNLPPQTIPKLQSLTAPQGVLISAAFAPSLSKLKRLDLVLNLPSSHEDLSAIANNCTSLETLIVTVSPRAKFRRMAAMFFSLIKPSASLRNLCVYWGASGTQFESAPATPFHSLVAGDMETIKSNLPPNLTLDNVFCHFFSDNLGFGVMGPYSVPACLFAEAGTIEEAQTLLPSMNINARLEDYPTPLALLLQILFETGHNDATSMAKFQALLQAGADPKTYFRMQYRNYYIPGSSSNGLNDPPTLNEAPLHHLGHLAVQGASPELLKLVLDSLGGQLDDSMLFDSAGYSIMHYFRATPRRTETKCLQLMLDRGYGYLMNHFQNPKQQLPIHSAVSRGEAIQNSLLFSMMFKHTTDPWQKRHDGTSLLTDILSTGELVSVDWAKKLSQDQLSGLADPQLADHPDLARWLDAAADPRLPSVFPALLPLAGLPYKKRMFEKLSKSLISEDGVRQKSEWIRIQELLASGLSMKDMESLEHLASRFLPLHTIAQHVYHDTLWELQNKYNADLTAIFRDNGGFVNTLLDMVNYHSLSKTFDEKQSDFIIRLFDAFKQKEWDDPELGLECRLAGAATLWATIINEFSVETPLLYFAKPKDEKRPDKIKLAIKTFKIVAAGLINDAAFTLADKKPSSALDVLYLLCSPAEKNLTQPLEDLVDKYTEATQSLPEKSVSYVQCLETFAKWAQEGRFSDA
jgi:hypothetical protein